MNEHVLSYCRNYIISDNNPQFAIFIKGPWGCGKTFFINQLLNSLDSGFDKKRIIRISLFGISSVEEIDRKIFEAVHPLLSSNGAKIAGTVLKTVLKLGVSFTTGKDGNIAVSPSNSFFDIEDFQTRVNDDKVIIVDDFERANIQPEAILGYFTNLIADSNNRVIFIGNEEKVQELKTFSLIKEKTIGLEFQITPDFFSALTCFINEIIEDEKVKTIVDATVRETNSILKCCNLRIIRQAIYNFNYLLQNITLKDDFDLSLIAKPFFVLFIQKSLNIITKGDSKGALAAFFNMNYRFDDYQNEKETHKDDSFWDFNIILDYDAVFSTNTWEEIIFNGCYPNDEINKELADYIARSDRTQKPLFDLFHWFELSSEDFVRIYKQVHNGFISKVYTQPGEIILYIQLINQLIEHELIEMTTDELTKDVETIIQSKAIKPLSEEQWQEMMSMNSYGYYGFSDFTNIWYRFLIDRVKEASLSMYCTMTKDSFCSEVSTIRDIDLFCKNLQNHNVQGKYGNVDVLSALTEKDIERFIQETINLQYYDIQKIISCFHGRYGLDRGNVIKPILLSEYENFCKITEGYKKALSKMEKHNNPHYFVIKYYVNQLDILERYLKEKKESFMLKTKEEQERISYI